jgi:hypothetical protein
LLTGALDLLVLAISTFHGHSSAVSHLCGLLCSIAVPQELSSGKMACPRGWASFPLCFFLVICLVVQLGNCNVVLMANNTTLSFDDVEATFSEYYSLCPKTNAILEFEICLTKNAILTYQSQKTRVS